MIKILPAGASAVAEIGSPPQQMKARGTLGDGSKTSRFILGTFSVAASWEDRLLRTEIVAAEGQYLQSISLRFRYRSAKPAADTAVWTETCTDVSSPSMAGGLPGPQRGMRVHKGRWGIWIGESDKGEGLFMGQDTMFKDPLSFACRPASHLLTITWTIDRYLDEGEVVKLSDVSIRWGEREKHVEKWRRKWIASMNRPPAVDRRKGWAAGEEVSSPRHLRECLTSLRSAKLSLDWFAVGPGYARCVGDWLETADEFRDRMGSVSRSIGEINLVPGIRFAPFLAGRNSVLAREKREWLVRGSKGQPITVPAYPSGRDPLFVLDVTNPQVMEHLKQLLTTMRDRWGFRVFILQRISDLLGGPERFDRSAAPGDLMKIAADGIRGALGPKVLALGSEVPLLGFGDTWDAVLAEAPSPSMSARRMMGLAFRMIRRSAWNGDAWVNAGGPLPLELFQDPADEAGTLRNAALFSSGMTVLSGDPRTLTEADVSRLQDYLARFDECRKGRLSVGGGTDGGRTHPIVVRNDRGWVALFNFTGKKRRIHLDRATLKSAHGITASLSAGDGSVFNSPEIHVTLPAWGNRLFRG